VEISNVLKFSDKALAVAIAQLVFPTPPFPPKMMSFKSRSSKPASAMMFTF